MQNAAANNLRTIWWYRVQNEFVYTHVFPNHVWLRLLCAICTECAFYRQHSVGSRHQTGWERDVCIFYAKLSVHITLLHEMHQMHRRFREEWRTHVCRNTTETMLCCRRSTVVRHSQTRNICVQQICCLRANNFPIDLLSHHSFAELIWHSWVVPTTKKTEKNVNFEIFYIANAFSVEMPLFGIVCRICFGA